MTELEATCGAPGDPAGFHIWAYPDKEGDVCKCNTMVLRYVPREVLMLAAQPLEQKVVI